MVFKMVFKALTDAVFTGVQGSGLPANHSNKPPALHCDLVVVSHRNARHIYFIRTKQVKNAGAMYRNVFIIIPSMVFSVVFKI